MPRGAVFVSSKGGVMTVVQATMYAGTLKWMGPVSDAEYSANRTR